MLDVDSLSYRLRTAMKSFLAEKPVKTGPDYSLIIETDFEIEKYKSKLDEKDPNMNSYGDFDDTIEFQTCQTVKTEIEAAIKEAGEKEANCQIIFSSDLISRISQDVLRMSTAEPCGIRGCAIHIMLQDKDKSRKIATIFGNPSTIPTFEIILTIKEDSRSWKMFQKMFFTIKGCILNSQWTSLPKILCSAYQLEKRRLYRRTDSRDSVNRQN